MKNIFRNIALLLTAVTLAACGDWTESEPLDYTGSPEQSIHGEEYYANLRAYKQSKHPVAFGWFGNWIGKGASTVNMLRGLPDSVDFVSMWGNWHSLTPEKMADKKEAYEKKGLRVMVCFIIANLGDQTTPSEVRKNWEQNGYSSETAAVNAFWGYDTSDGSTFEPAVRKYVRSIVDTIDKYDWNGFDFDLEPNYGSYGNISSSSQALGYVIDEFSKYLGPLSGTDRMLAVDGEPYEIPAEYAPAIDWFIIQAYACPGDTSLDSRLSRLVNAFGKADENGNPYQTPEEVLSKTIWTENFESYAAAGGVSFVNRYGETMTSLKGMAGYSNPAIKGKIGGVGTYHMEYDTNYKYLREAIGVMNPVIEY